MSFAEDILKLRKRVADAVASEIINPDGKDSIEAILIQILNEAEKSRQGCVLQADNLRKQLSTVEGSALAYNSFSSIIYNVINSYVILGEKEKKERERIEAERLEMLQAQEDALKSQEDSQEEMSEEDEDEEEMPEEESLEEPKKRKKK